VGIPRFWCYSGNPGWKTCAKNSACTYSLTPHSEGISSTPCGPTQRHGGPLGPSMPLGRVQDTPHVGISTYRMYPEMHILRSRVGEYSETCVFRCRTCAGTRTVCAQDLRVLGYPPKGRVALQGPSTPLRGYQDTHMWDSLFLGLRRWSGRCAKHPILGVIACPFSKALDENGHIASDPLRTL